MNEEDKRVIRTRAQLTEALIELSCAEGYDAVTVQSLTEKAGINYRTFYRHYESKDDLLREVLQSTLSDLRRTMPPPTPKELSNPDFDEIAGHKARILYQYVVDNKQVFQLLLQSGPVALEPIQKYARKETEHFFEDMPQGKIPHDLIANHMISSTFSMIQWWLENDMPYTPEEMGEYQARLIMLPIRRLLVGSNMSAAIPDGR